MLENKNLNFLKRLNFAFAGIQFALKSEKSFRTHLLISIGLLFLSLIIHPDSKWSAIFCICVGNVLACELINSALEALCHFVSIEQQPQIKIAKDCAAGAVLISSIASVAVFGIFLTSL